MAQIAALSIAVSAFATLVAALVAVPGALWIVYGRSPLRGGLLALFTVGLGLPPVAVGLAVAFAFWRSGPFGWVDLLYTPYAMALAQIVIVVPLVGTFAVVALRGNDATLAMQLAGLGLARVAGSACSRARSRRVSQQRRSPGSVARSRRSARRK